MKYKIIVDSSSDLRSDYIKDSEVDFEIVPLSVKIVDKEFVDTADAFAEDMLAAYEQTTEKCTSSCPSPGNFAESFTAEYNFCCTMTSKLSGTYNSALLASKMIDDKKVFVLDSLATVGCLALLVDKIYECIKKGMKFEEICESVNKYRDSLTLLFILDKFDNLVKNGRMSRVSSLVAGFLNIKPLCVAHEGEIKMLEKPRTRKLAHKRLIANMLEKHTDFSKHKCIISFCVNEELAFTIKKMIEEVMNFKEIIIRRMKVLSSFYALENGIIVSFD